MVDFLFGLIELFSLSITLPELWGEMRRARLFSQWVDLFALKFYQDRVVLHQPFWRQKTRENGLSHDKTASFRVPLFWHNTGVWRTDGRSDMPYNIQRFQSLARCKNGNFA